LEVESGQNPAALVDGQEAAALLAEGCLVWDVTNRPDEYDAGHLPGAVPVAWRADLTATDAAGVEYQLPEPANGEARLRRLGLRNDSRLLVYDRHGGLYAARAFWTLRCYGFERAHILDGGLGAWQGAGLPVSTERVTAVPGDFTARDESEWYLATSEDVRAATVSAQQVLLDTRSWGEYNGTIARAKRAGRIPGSRHMEWSDLNTEGKRLRDAKDLQALSASRGLAEAESVITYCQAGIRASYTWFVLSEVLGMTNVFVYDGSWGEWGNRDDLPIEV
jgi:thiosulfate/3-mercaptopyruvate sulfurtransferase